MRERLAKVLCERLVEDLLVVGDVGRVARPQRLRVVMSSQCWPSSSPSSSSSLVLLVLLSVAHLVASEDSSSSSSPSLDSSPSSMGTSSLLLGRVEVDREVNNSSTFRAPWAPLLRNSRQSSLSDRTILVPRPSPPRLPFQMEKVESAGLPNPLQCRRWTWSARHVVGHRYWKKPTPNWPILG